MSTRTSHTHPLRIDELAIPGVPGILGLTFCPGKVDHHALTGSWERDLATDIAAISAWGAKSVITLLEDYELERLKVPDLGMALVSARLSWYLMPIRDGGVPGQPFEEAWDQNKHEIHRRLSDGEKILIHCRGGLGRTGLVAGLILVESGVTADQAIKMVRKARHGCIENTAQEQYVLNAVKRSEPRLIDKIRGCLLAGACGDALGAPVEFLSVDDIVSQYGKPGIRDFGRAYGRVGAITDDTQMTMFTAEGLIRAWVRGLTKGICHPPSIVHLSYLRWLITQSEDPDKALDGYDIKSGWLITNKELWSRRAPGNTCLSALRATKKVASKATNDSKGCGGIMRVAPAGFIEYHEIPFQSAFELGSDLANQTHGHPSGYLASGFFTALIFLLNKGVSLSDAISNTTKLLLNFPGHEEVLNAVNAAVKLAEKGPSRYLLPSLGQGWVAEEALAISLYCALTCDTLEEAVILAVNHTGDSDSTGSMTGQIHGVIGGYSAIPTRWLNQLELRETIDTLAQDLARVLNGFVSGEALWDSYPGY